MEVAEGYLGLETVRHGDTSQCIQDIFNIHFPNARTVADLTWGKGRFWNKVDGLDIVGLDVDTRGGAQVVSNYQTVPLRDQSVDVAVFDPPFIFSPGLRGIVGAKRFFLGSDGHANERFYGGADNRDLRVLAPRNADDLHQQTITVLHEMLRVARYGMILKGQDLITSKHPNWWSWRVMSAARGIISGQNDSFGWKRNPMPEDMLLQVSPAARMRDPRWKKQYHFRRRHAIYIVYTWAPEEINAGT